MSLVIASFFFIAFIIAAMAVSVYFGRPPIKGTCGGLNQMMNKKNCDFCGGDADKCDSASENQSKDSPQLFDPSSDAIRKT